MLHRWEPSASATRRFAGLPSTVADQKSNLLSLPSLLDFLPAPDSEASFVELEEECTLEAVFQSGSYDSFIVLNSDPLRCAIEKVRPDVARGMKSNLHMTVSFPGRRNLAGLSTGFCDVLRRLPVLLFVRKIYVGDGVGSAVVYGINAPVRFMTPMESNGRPAHLTLFGNPAEKAGRVLIGKKLELREPFIQVCPGYMEALLKAQIKFTDDLNRAQQMAFAKVRVLEQHLGVIGPILSRHVVPIQAAVRRLLAQQKLVRLRNPIVLQAAGRRLLARRHVAKIHNTRELQACLTTGQHRAFVTLVRLWRKEIWRRDYEYGMSMASGWE